MEAYQRFNYEQAGPVTWNDSSAQLRAIALYLLDSITYKRLPQPTICKINKLLTDEGNLNKSLQGYQPIYQELKFKIREILQLAFESAENGQKIRNRAIQFAFIAAFRNYLKATNFQQKVQRAIEKLNALGLVLPIVQQHFGSQIRIIRTLQSITFCGRQNQSKIRVWDEMRQPPLLNTKYIPQSLNLQSLPKQSIFELLRQDVTQSVPQISLTQLRNREINFLNKLNRPQKKQTTQFQYFPVKQNDGRSKAYRPDPLNVDAVQGEQNAQQRSPKSIPHKSKSFMFSDGSNSPVRLIQSPLQTRDLKRAKHNGGPRYCWQKYRMR